MLNEELCWNAVLDRDAQQDGRFLFGVKTTGIFCRPSCASRRPLRKNVRFFETAKQARAAGLRPCMRCKPAEAAMDSRVVPMRQLCAFIQNHCDSGDPLTLEVLARQAEMTPSRLRRTFREVVGVTPRQYVEACRFGTLKEGLKSGDPVTRAIYEAGFGSPSQVYEQATERFGMTPGEYRSGGQGQVISFALSQTEAGRMMVAATDRGLCFAQFGDSDSELFGRLKEEFPAADLREMEPQAQPHLEAWLGALGQHLSGEEPHLDLPVDIRATAFQLRVWNFLQTIPYGETRSYSEVAQGIGKPRAVRAVATACASNRIAIAIPCHRVIRADGNLGDYRWGRERKRSILEREASVQASLAGSERRQRARNHSHRT
ncbi:MAG: bifunctional DNA-binding transcriptional regulator/O6-methylguanine-DNA methyltransferase Ada [Deltaproteobacteria bacterium]|nr:bifunctional DNA-binding transcriptional regulator/O6-methylguanine-DNA methyltransferase Ada [Deltaproteobacteria bacterium]